MNLFCRIMSAGLGPGYFPFAPGTVGSAWAGAIILLLAPWWSVPLALALTVVVFFFGVFVTTRAERCWGHDDGRMVIDEIAAMFLTMAFVPVTVYTVLLGFFLFRYFDVVKLPPARQAEDLPGGWGVMSDDLVAAIYSALTMWGSSTWT